MRAHLISSDISQLLGWRVKVRQRSQAQAPLCPPLLPCLAQLHAAPLQQAFLAPCVWESGPSDWRRGHLGLPTAEGRCWLTIGTHKSYMYKKQRMCENVKGTGSQAQP